MTEATQRFWWRALSALLALGTLLVALPAEAQNPEEARIQATRARLAEIREELDEAREQATEDQLALEEADARVREVLDAVASAEQAVQRQRVAVDDARRELGVRQEALAAQQAVMAERLARLYRQTRPDPVLSLLDASTISSAVLQSTYMVAIGREDRASFEQLANAETAVAAQQEALAEEEAALERVLEEQQALLAEVEEIRNDRALLAAASQELVARLQAEESYLEAESRELAARARAAEEAAAAAAAAAAAPSGGGGGGGASDSSDAPTSRPAAGDQGQGSDSSGGDGGTAAPEPVTAPAAPAPSGGFAWPTSGPITSPFGPRWGRMHEGIDIGGGTGQAVSAARGGTVVQAGSMSGYGNVVMIAHGGGFVTVYAHLDSIAVSSGASVSTGTYLGGMGCTGSCTGTHLHFEIRANGTPQNPLNYL